MGITKLSPNAPKLVKNGQNCSKCHTTVLYGNIRTRILIFGFYSPIFNPVELKYNTLRHLKWLGIPKLVKKLLKCHTSVSTSHGSSIDTDVWHFSHFSNFLPILEACDSILGYLIIVGVLKCYIRAQQGWKWGSRNKKWES